MKKEKRANKIIIKINIIWIFILAIFCGLIYAFFKNNIFATDKETEVSKVEAISAIEENQNAVNILELMVSNNYSNKKLINEEREVKFQTKIEKSDKLPKGEKKVKQEGKNGKIQVTAMQTFEENKFMQEEILETVLKKDAVKEIIVEGTSEFLSKYNVHIGDDMYLIETGDIKEKDNETSQTITTLKRYLNVTLEDFSEEWAKIKYKDYEGYIQISKLTSETVSPMIEEKNRIAKLQANLSFDMNVATPSGLTLNDFKSILSSNASDKNKIFADNAEVFYNMEQEYGINGIFIASIGIHESAWGTSAIAREKNNLFGYRAYDRSPMESAKDFEDYEECINVVAEALSKNYLTETGSYYNGKTIESVNKKYASDEGWARKVYAYMEYLYDKL